MSTTRAVTLSLVVCAILALAGCPPVPGDSGLVTISGSATASTDYYAEIVGTPAIELQQESVPKYTLALNPITDGWDLESTDITSGTYDIVVTITTTSSASPATVTSLTVNGVVVDPGIEGFAETHSGGDAWLCTTTIPDVSIVEDADLVMTVESIPW